MPRIPDFLAQQGLPASGGLPRQTVPIPVVPEPGADVQSYTQVDQAVGQLGAALGQSGQQLAQADALAGHRQKAFDVLNAKTELQDSRVEQMTALDALKEGDWQTLPQRFLAESDRLIAERGNKLTPQARALFVEDAKQARTVLYQQALTERTRRMDQVTSYTLMTEVQQAQEAAVKATDPYARQVALGQLDDLLAKFASMALADGAKLADIGKKTREGIAVRDVQTAIQAYPDAMRLQLRNQAQGQPTREDLPTAPPEHLAQLAQEASEVARQRVTDQERDEQIADKRLHKQQEQEAKLLSEQITGLVPLPENVPMYDALLTTVNAKATSNVIDFAQQQHFVGMIKTLRTAALNPPQYDDPATERRVAVMIAAANNPTDLADVRQELVTSAPKLKPETFGKFDAQLRERARSDHWSNLPGVKDGMRTIVGGEVSEGVVHALLRGAQNEAEQAAMRKAVDAYTGEVARIAERSTTEANARAPQIAREVREAYMDKPEREAMLNRLPLPLQGRADRRITDPKEAQYIVDHLPYITPAEKQREYDNWRRWRLAEDRAAATSSSTTPTPSRSGSASAPSPSGRAGSEPREKVPY